MRSRRVLELAFGIAVTLLLSLGTVYTTGPHDGPHRPPTVTTDTGTSQGACQEGTQR